MPHTVDIVIVNWNVGPLLRGCLQSIERLTDDISLVGKVIVVDNASSDDSMEKLPLCGGRVQVIRCAQNEGFARACNIGAASVTAEFTLFLNPDTELREGVLARTLKAAAAGTQSSPSVVGVRMLRRDGSVMKNCARFPTAIRSIAACAGLDRAFPSIFPPHLLLEWDYASTGYVDQVMGAFFLVRTGEFRALGGFDERFFVYYEELDYCFRAAKAGRRALYLGDVEMLHVGRGSSGQINAIATFYSSRSKIVYARKHFSWAAFLAVAAATLILEPTVRLVAATVRRSRRELCDTLVGFGYLWSWAFTGRPARGVVSRSTH